MGSHLAQDPCRRFVFNFASDDPEHSLDVTTWMAAGSFWITACGQLDAETEQVLLRALRLGQRRGARRIVLDLSAASPRSWAHLRPCADRCRELTTSGIDLTVIDPVVADVGSFAGVAGGRDVVDA